jgi:flagellar hook-associated protein 3 FlgL
MSSSFISTFSLMQSTMLQTQRVQSQLADSQKEVTTGRLADVGLTLGYKTTNTLSLRQGHDRYQTLMDSNSVVSTRLEGSQGGLSAVHDTAQSLLNALLGASNSSTSPGTIVQAATQGLGSLVDTLNMSVGGVSLFGGINTDTLPLKQYFSQPPPASKQAVDTAFQSAFGMAQSDSNVSTITGAQMQSFLDNQFDAEFQDPNWAANWSPASTQTDQSRISTSEVVQTSVSASDPTMRKLVQAFTMVADLGTANLNQNAYQAVVNKATKLIGDALGGISNLQSVLGLAQDHITKANDRMSVQVALLEKQINGLESVDPYEASTRVSSLMTQIETSYSLTARVQKLTLLNYL